MSLVRCFQTGAPESRPTKFWTKYMKSLTSETVRIDWTWLKIEKSPVALGQNDSGAPWFQTSWFPTSWAEPNVNVMLSPSVWNQNLIGSTQSGSYLVGRDSGHLPEPGVIIHYALSIVYNSLQNIIKLKITWIIWIHSCFINVWFVGSISIDGINIANVPLVELRGRLAIIPQDPALFIGTVR